MSIISLTSDIGHKDYMTGAIKGRLWSVQSNFQIADISHEVTPFNYNEAVYFVKSSYRHFPPFSWHIILVNVFDAPLPRCILAFFDGHYFAAPDNGLLPMIFDCTPEHAVVLPSTANGSSNILGWVESIGRAIQQVHSGEAFHKLGEEPDTLVEKISLKPTYGDDWMEGRIVFIDRFENVVVNITKELFETIRQGRSFYIEFKSDERVTKLVEHYGMVPEGDKLAFFNTAGYLEIAVNKGNAAGLFGLQAAHDSSNSPFQKSRQFYQSVRVHFK